MYPRIIITPLIHHIYQPPTAPLTPRFHHFHPHSTHLPQNCPKSTLFAQEFFERVPHATLYCFRRLLIVGCIGSIIGFSIIIRALFFDLTTTRCSVYDSEQPASTVLLLQVASYIPFVDLDLAETESLTETCTTLINAASPFSNEYISPDLLPADATADDLATTNSPSVMFESFLYFAHAQPNNKRIVISAGLQGYIRHVVTQIANLFQVTATSSTQTSKPRFTTNEFLLPTTSPITPQFGQRYAQMQMLTAPSLPSLHNFLPPFLATFVDSLPTSPLSTFFFSTPAALSRLAVSEQNPITLHKPHFHSHSHPADSTLHPFTIAELLEVYPAASIPPNIFVNYASMADHLTILFLAARVFVMATQLLLRIYYLFIYATHLNAVLENNPRDTVQEVGRKLFTGPLFRFHMYLGTLGQRLFQFSFIIMLAPTIDPSLQYLETTVRLLTIHYVLTTLIAVNESETFMRQYYAVVDRNAYEYSVESKATTVDLEKYCFSPNFGPLLTFLAFTLYRFPQSPAALQQPSVKLLKLFKVDLDRLLTQNPEAEAEDPHDEFTPADHDVPATPTPVVAEEGVEAEQDQNQTTAQPQATQRALKSSNVVLNYLLHSLTTHLSCPICLLEFQFNDPVMILPCHHTYHSHCAKKWLFTKGACPMCLKPIRKCPPEQLTALSERVLPEFKSFMDEFSHLIDDFSALPHTHDILTAPSPGLSGFIHSIYETGHHGGDKGDHGAANANDQVENELEINLEDVDPHLLHLDSLVQSIIHQHIETIQNEQEYSDDYGD